jgi:Protein of unknown function (DUF742)
MGHVDPVRPYLLTSGRVRPDDAQVEIESQILVTAAGWAALADHRFELRAIVALCERPMAVAEVAARLDLHLAVARVLVGDLIALGHLTVRRPERDPNRRVPIIERAIDALQAID